MTTAAQARPLRVPDTLDDALSPEWLSAALGTRFPGVEVTAVVRGALDDRISTNAAFSIECAGGRPAGLPAALWLKGYFGELGIRARSAGTSEAAFYAHLADGLGVRTLQCLYVDVEPETQANVVITADVAGGQFLDARSSYSADLAAESLAQLAALHASTWRSAALADVPWLQPRAAAMLPLTAPVVERNLAAAPAESMPAAVRDPERVVAACRAVADEIAATDDWTVTHGDAHLGNVFLDRTGRPCLLDWQLVHRGAWYVDVGYHLAAALPPGERRRHERDLLAGYLDRMRSAGIPLPALEEALPLLRRGVAYGLYLWSITMRVDPAVITVMLERMGQAAVDHGALALAG